MDFTHLYGDSYHQVFPTSTSHLRPTMPSRQPSLAHGTASGHSSFGGGGNGTSSHHQENRPQKPEQPLPMSPSPPPPPPPPTQQQKMAADQAYRATFASHERAVFQEEALARARRRDAARNRALFRGRLYKRPEFYAITIGVLGLLYPVLNQYVVQPWLERRRHHRHGV
ncbi:uncharacterized protein GGS25DRAFT_527193 [Hypoxylon fragiforme]|uniref:uncharacterized protein n=1 Tax=Hypoxylon fragiforme TaxID=63214 RepID=UPI0020C6F344|nr:uncharacterized protein GGS25DRAFT_527193 [Hypoxylon fragiforme]KAI2614087.1 hypothetical protein GGS25DRAFT_527193 [Hypoxylon fragiforme]